MRLSGNTHVPTRRNVEMHIVMAEPTRELADRVARRMGCSRSEAFARGIRLLDSVQTRGEVRP